tara:strand:- start:15220 stop:17121 length:1902 start_codon:yes stop_codon:yes gene_type:complete
MPKKRNTKNRPINAEYLRQFYYENYSGKLKEFTAAVNSSSDNKSLENRSISRALAGEPLNPNTIDMLCKVNNIDVEKLCTIPERMLVEEDHQITIEPKDEVKQPVIISLVSSKGGVGKTTLAINLAIELARGCKVALVDIDLFTCGATHWLKSFLNPDVPHVSFVQLAIPNRAQISSKNITQIPIATEIPGEEDANLYFVPSYSKRNLTTKNVTIPPILVDWSIQETIHSVESAMKYLAKMDFDVIILDCHPGLLNLTQAICTHSDCNILVSDYEHSTLYTNWLLSWQIQRLQLQAEEMCKNSTINSKRGKWRIAVNKIPSEETTNNYADFVEEIRIRAWDEWNIIYPESQIAKKVVTEIGTTVYAIPDIEGMRLENEQHVNPTSIKRRGGNACLLATRNIIRRLILDGVLGNLEDKYDYAKLHNKIAGGVLESYIKNYVSPIKQGWDGAIPNLSKILYLAIVIYGLDLFLVSFGIKEENHEMILRPLFSTSSGIFPVIILSSFSYSIARIIKEILKELNRISNFLDIVSVQGLTLKRKLDIYEEGLYRSGQHHIAFYFIWLLGFASCAFFAAVHLRFSEAYWTQATLIFSTVIFVFVVATAKGKRKSLALLINIFPYVLRKWMDNFRNKFQS